MDPETLDVRGLKCPLPVLKAEKRLGAMPAGSRLLVLTTDPMALVDIPHFCSQAGYLLCRTERTADMTVFEIEKVARGE